MADARDLNLRLTYWFLNHRDQLKKWWVMALLGVDVLLIFAWIIGMVVVVTDGSRLRRSVPPRLGAPLFAADARALLAQPLTIGTAAALPGEPNKVTLAARLTNPNLAYAVGSVQFRFNYNGNATPVRTTFLMANSERFVYESNVTAATTGQPTLEIVAVDWQRPAIAGLPVSLALSVVNPTVDLAARTSTLPSRPAPRLTATLKNDTVFTFRKAEVSIALVSKGAPVAVGTVLLRDWKTFSDQPVEFQWLGPVPSDVVAQFYPQIDLFDPQTLVH